MSSSPRRSPRPTEKRSVSKTVKDALQTFSLRARPCARAIGSLLYKVMKYPSDIDAFEMYEVQGTPVQAATLCARALKRLATRIQQQKDAYWKEAKIGQDVRYAIPECEYRSGRLSYDVKQVKNYIDTMKTSGLLTAEEARSWKKQVKAEVTYAEYVTFQDLFYNKLVLRWSSDEVLAGYKTLKDGTKITLEAAILNGGDIKVDGILYLKSTDGSRWVEVSNYVILKARGKSISTDPFARKLGPSIAFDMMGYLGPEKHKAMKIAKRLWSISTYLNDTTALYLLTPLMSSDAALLHQLQGTVEAVETVTSIDPHRRTRVNKDLLALTDMSLAQIENPTFFSEEEKATLRNVISSGSYVDAVELISIKTDGYARMYLEITGLMTRVINTVIDNAAMFQVCD